MSKTADGRVTYEAECPRCGEERPVMHAAPGIADICVECGANVEDGGR